MTDRLDSATEIVPIQLSGDASGPKAYIQAIRLDDAEVSPFKALNMHNLVPIVHELATAVRDGLERARPSKATVELGLSIAVESGELTALILKGQGNANLKITLEWEHKP